MSFNFPNSPTGGQTYQPVGGPTYTWDGTAWVIASPNTVTAQTRNRIVNGGMTISQENGTTAITVNGYPVDQWMTYVTAGTITSQKLYTAPSTPTGSIYRVRLTATAGAAPAAGSIIQFVTAIEGIRVQDSYWGTAAAKQMILRFTFKGPAGTYAISLRNGASNRSYTAPFTVAAGQANVDTTQTFIIPGDTTGTWDTATNVAIQLAIIIYAGATYQTAPNVWTAGNFLAPTGMANNYVTNAIFEITDVGLYLDPNATGVPPPWQMPDEAQELAACQRYYCKVTYSVGGNGVSNYAIQMVYFPVAMRITPAIANVAPGSNASMVVNGTTAHDNLSMFAQCSTGALGAYLIGRTEAFNARM